MDLIGDHQWEATNLVFGSSQDNQGDGQPGQQPAVAREHSAAAKQKGLQGSTTLRGSPTPSGKDKFAEKLRGTNWEEVLGKMPQKKLMYPGLKRR